jgi:2-keto-4-pentenoate hydratase/2-oxohepta-3-ene-1,7-dioic acid hydratase in catechol pathway
MLFGVPQFIAEMTKYFTLWPGDVIWMGTDGRSPDIKAGDVVEIEISGVGTLRNKFVAESNPALVLFTARRAWHNVPAGR